METLITILHNRTAMMAFGAVVLLSSSGFLGIRVIPRHFNSAQIKKILHAAAFTCGIIGAFPIAIVLFFFLEDWITSGLDHQDWRFFLTMAAISGFAYLLLVIFIGIEKELNKKLRYKDMGLIYKILAGFALFIGVVGLFGIKALKESPQHYDFYAEEDQGGEELEELELE